MKLSELIRLPLDERVSGADVVKISSFKADKRLVVTLDIPAGAVPADVLNETADLMRQILKVSTVELLCGGVSSIPENVQVMPAPPPAYNEPPRQFQPVQPPAQVYTPPQRSGGGARAKAHEPQKMTLPYENGDFDGEIEVILGRKDLFVSPPTPMERVKHGANVMWGRIFGVDSRDIHSKKNGKDYFLFTAQFSDGTSSFTVKYFTTPDNKDMLKSLKKDTAILAVGDVVFDEREHGDILEPRGIAILKTRPPADKGVPAPEGAQLPFELPAGETYKRVELHAHSNMSDMDGLTPVSKLVQRAWDYGHYGFAITDHGNVQAFPEAMNTFEKLSKSDPARKFKMIYGMEAYFVNDGKVAVSEGNMRPLDGEFIVFDVETTGLSAGSDRIIELGAVRVKNLTVTDTFDVFIKTGQPLPTDIIKLTGITDEMLRTDGVSEKDALDRFYKFCGTDCQPGSGPLLMAHNADFDMGFLRALAKRCGVPAEFPAVDTLAISRRALPQLKSHKLVKLAAHYKFDRDENGEEIHFHRACDDAAVTAKIFIRMITDARKKGKLTVFGDINSVFGSLDVKKAETYHMIILAATQAGLKNLYKLVSFSNLNFFHSKPRIPLSLLKEYREGLLVGSACEAGELYRAVLANKPREVLTAIAENYDYFEIQPVGNNMFLQRRGDVANTVQLQLINKKIFELGKELGKPVAATCDVHFLNPEDSIFREILQTGQGYEDASSQAPLYLRSTDKMIEEFEYLGEQGAFEVVVNGPARIAAQLEQLRPIPKGTFTPSIDGAEEELKQLCYDRAREWYGDSGEGAEIAKARLDKELGSIIKYGFSVLYIIAQKLVKRSEECGYLVGSRGSVGSSFAATASGISEVNPLPPHYRCPKCRYSKFFTDGSVGSGFDLPPADCPECGAALIGDGHDIPFETFLGFKGDKAPDIDLNFSGEYQSESHRYTEELFGKSHVYKAGTISAVQDKTAFGFVKKFLESKGMTVSKAEENRLVAGCVGVKRTTSQHPGGMVVVPKEYEVYDFTPVQHPANKDEEDTITTHFDFHALHDTILKLDELGHDVPTLYKRLEELTGRKISDVPCNDPDVYSLFTSIDKLGLSFRDAEIIKSGTYGLPEFGTDFVIGMLKEAKPKNFSDLLQISGLSHGTDVWLGNARELIVSGQCTISDVIGTRDDIMVYLLHKGMEPPLAFRIMEITRKGGAAAQFDDEIYKAFESCGVEQWYIDSCKKIKYMFPKAHAAAYVTSAVKLGWFKVHMPLEFYAAVLTKHTENLEIYILLLHSAEKVRQRMMDIRGLEKATAKEEAAYEAYLLVYEMFLRGYDFLPPRYDKSKADRYVIEDGKLRLPFMAVSGCGESAARKLCDIIAAGDFLCVQDIQTKAGINKSVIEALCEFDVFEGLDMEAQMTLF